MNKKKALKYLENRYERTHITTPQTHEKYHMQLSFTGLCEWIENENLNKKWQKHWDEINNENKAYMTGYFYYGYGNVCEEENILLRLLSLHMFLNSI